MILQILARCGAFFIGFIVKGQMNHDFAFGIEVNPCVIEITIGKSIKYFFFIINLYSDLGGFQFSVASDGTPTYKPGGADTAYPFNSGMQKIVSVSTYCKFIGYDKTVFVSIVFDISKCKLMITTNINNSWFQYLYALSSTTSLPGDSVLSPNKNYDLSNYNYLRLTFNLPTGNYDGSNSTSLGTIQFK